MAVEAGTLEKGEGGRGLGAMIARSVVDGSGLLIKLSQNTSRVTIAGHSEG
ncbi:hypothetical protein U1Q18_003712 [Sarracenia purpurea var. burkii]